MKKMEIKILNLNCFGLPLFFNKKLRHNFFLKKIKELNYDILFLQEIFFKKEAKKISKALANSGYETFFRTKKCFNLGGLLIVSRIKNIQAEYIPFVDQGPKTSFTSLLERIIKKGFLSLKAKIGKKELFFITTHLTYASAKKLAKRNGKKVVQFTSQINQLSSFLKNKENSIFGGDFNFLPSFSLYEKVKKEIKCQEVSSGKIKTLDASNFYRRKWIKLGFENKEPTVKDFLFYKGRVKKIKAQRVWDIPFVFKNKHYFVSDHYGIEAVFDV